VGEIRWAFTKLSEEELEAALMVAWGLPEGEGGRDIHTEVEWLQGIMHRVCDAAMPRAMSRPRRAVSWWTDKITKLRRSSVQARRTLSRLPFNVEPEEREEALAALRAARCALTLAIRKSRAKCWDDLLKSLNMDPWGRPYKIVMKRHRAWTPPVTQSLESHVLRQVVDTLFPQGMEGVQIWTDPTG